MVGRFTFTATPLQGLWQVVRHPQRDERGFFARFFCATEFLHAGVDRPIAQINHSHTSRRGSVRGLHFQHPPHAETKVVNCVRGEVFDVAVDLRRGSPTFLHWHGARLSADNGHGLVIPPGFAHGFQTLSDDCELIYLHTVPYTPAAEGALNIADPRLAIRWPLPIADVSARDRAHPFIDDDYAGVAL